MLQDMPVGDPTLSLETNLDNIFGFVYGEITCPNEQVLRVPFIQYRDPYKNIVSCPRGKFSRLIFSQEIKYALKFGYTIDIKYCYLFKRGKDLFTKYVQDHFKIKSTSTDSVQYSMAKLFLNTLYGKLGMKPLLDTLNIVTEKEAETLDQTTNVSILSKLADDKYLVKYSGQINDNIRKLNLNDPITKKNKNRVYTSS